MDAGASKRSKTKRPYAEYGEHTAGSRNDCTGSYLPSALYRSRNGVALQRAPALCRRTHDCSDSHILESKSSGGRSFVHRVLSIMLASFGGVVAVLIVTAPPSPLELATEAQDKELLTEWLRVEVEQLLPIATRGTRFEHAWAINTQHREGWLTVYLLAPSFWDVERLSPKLQAMRGNCAHVGHGIIFCDTWFLDRFLSERRLNQGPPLALDGRENHFRTFLLWILAHEVAHAIKGHGPMHFGESGFDEMITGARASHRFEFEADSHIVSLLDYEPDLYRDILRLFSDLLRAEGIRNATGRYPSPFEFATGSISSGIDIPIRDDISHPDFVLRIARIIKLVSERDEPGNHILRVDVDRLIDRLHLEPRP